MRCCILYNQPGENALADELDILDQVGFVEKNLRLIHIDTWRKGLTNNFMAEIEELAAQKPDFVFNLTESINNKGELLYFIPALLNMHAIPYTGNPLEAMFITTSKMLTYKLLVKEGLNAPFSVPPSKVNRLTAGKKYIIKPVWEDGSQGITPDSVFTFHNDLVEKYSTFSDTYWFIQEFIDGREFNVSMISGSKGPEVLPPAEMTFVGYGEDRPKIVDFKAKWDTDSYEYVNTVRRFPGKELDPVLEKRINDLSLACWEIFGLKGFARVDLRVDNDNNPYVIEVNANPCISPNSGFVAATAAAGYEFADVLKWIIGDMNR